MLAVVAPGQGSQRPGMLNSWLAPTSAARQLAAWSDAAGLDLETLGTTASADEIKDTAVTQPLIVAASLLAATQLELPADVVLAGHSVGELAAAALAGVWSADDAVRLAAIRGRAMARACADQPTSMAAVLGGDPEVVLAALESRKLVGANRNGAGQIVAAGPVDAIEQLVAAPPAGARVMPLAVAGAFHTGYMAAAEGTLADAMTGTQVHDPTCTLLTNATGLPVNSGTEYARLLVGQLTRPVRWDLCMATFDRLGVTGVLELPPSGALVGLVKRELKGVATLGVKTPEDLEKVRDFVAEHSAVAA